MTSPSKGAGHERPGPTARLERILTARRLPFVFGTVLILVSIIQIMVLVSAHHAAAIKADSYSYLAFAKELADGNVRMTGVLADAIEKFSENDELVTGPIWNTHVTPEGQTVFTVAVGYPLVLAAAWVLGGLWLVINLNIVLLSLLLLLIVIFLWDRLGRDILALSVAGCAILIFVAANTDSPNGFDAFRQFSHPWREPLFYLCVLAAAWAAAAYVSSGRLRFVAAAGLLLGYACAVKESNIIYAFIIGLFILFGRRPLRFGCVARAVGLYAACGVAGVMPLLIQNTFSTGNPYRSLQSLRASEGALSIGPQSGWSPGNIPVTVKRYAQYYYAEFGPTILIAFGVLVLIGIIVGRKTPLVRVMGGLLLIHVAFYAPWGNAEFRHSYFAHVPLSFYCALGLVHLVGWVTRPIPCIELYRYWVPLIPLVVLAAKPPPWRMPDNPPFSYANAAALTAEIEQRSDDGSVIFCNRELRNILDVYGTHPVIRLHDLARFHPEGNEDEVIRHLLDEGLKVLFLNNRDKDPRNLGRVDWTRKDQALLLEHYDLAPAYSIPGDRNGLKGFLDRSARELTAFHVSKWTNQVVRRALVVPEEGAAFVFVNPRGASDHLEMSLDGERIDTTTLNGFFVPKIVPPGENQVFEASAGGSPIPSLSDTKLVGWFEEIGQPLGTDALHRDAAFFPDGVEDSDASWRYVTNSTVRMRVPVRHRPDLFSTIGLKVELKSEIARTRITLPTGETYVGEPRALTAYFPVNSDQAESPSVGYADFTVHSEDGATIKLMRIESYASRTQLTVPSFEDTLGVGLTGQLTSTEIGVGPHAWAVNVNGVETRSGKCMADPGRGWNRFALAIDSVEGHSPAKIEFQRAGLIGAEWSRVGDRMNLTTRSGLNGFMEDFNNKEKDFWWSKGKSRVYVPVRKDRPSYRLQLDISSGRPGHKAPVTVRFSGAEQVVETPDKRSTIELTLVAGNKIGDGLEPLQFVVETWQPESETRSLGFQLFGLKWGPVD
jgi:hypothetical protein